MRALPGRDNPDGYPLRKVCQERPVRSSYGKSRSSPPKPARLERVPPRKGPPRAVRSRRRKALPVRLVPLQARHPHPCPLTLAPVSLDRESAPPLHVLVRSRAPSSRPVWSRLRTMGRDRKGLSRSQVTCRHDVAGKRTADIPKDRTTMSMPMRRNKSWSCQFLYSPNHSCRTFHPITTAIIEPTPGVGCGRRGACLGSSIVWDRVRHSACSAQRKTETSEARYRPQSFRESRMTVRPPLISVEKP
jgi:hypothetical protein